MNVSRYRWLRRVLLTGQRSDRLVSERVRVLRDTVRELTAELDSECAKMLTAVPPEFRGQA